jgi:hypothetical protein
MDFDELEKNIVSLPDPSNEQLDAIKKIERNNAVIDSVDGCEKNYKN